jgi:hypothetical protein
MFTFACWGQDKALLDLFRGAVSATDKSQAKRKGGAQLHHQIEGQLLALSGHAATPPARSVPNGQRTRGTVPAGADAGSRSDGRERGHETPGRLPARREPATSP